MIGHDPRTVTEKEISIEFPGSPNLDLSPNRRDGKGWRSRHAAVKELTTLNYDKLAASLAPAEPMTTCRYGLPRNPCCRPPEKISCVVNTGVHV